MGSYLERGIYTENLGRVLNLRPKFRGDIKLRRPNFSGVGVILINPYQMFNISFVTDNRKLAGLDSEILVVVWF